MIPRYLKTVFFLFLLFPCSLFGQYFSDRQVIRPFEDYAQCKVGFLSGKGDTLFPAKFENPKHIHAVSYQGREMIDSGRDWAWILSENGQFGCLSELGQWIIPCKYEELEFNSRFGVFVARYQGKYGVIDLRNMVVVPFEFDQIRIDYELPPEITSSVVVLKDNHIGLYNFYTGKIISPVYDSLSVLKFGDNEYRTYRNNPGKHFGVYLDHKMGISSREKEELIAPLYKSIVYIEEEEPNGNPVYFLVTDQMDRKAVFDENGKQLTPFIRGKITPVYDRGENWQMPMQFVEVEDSVRSKHMIRLSTGQRTEPYTHKSVFENCIYVNFKSKWKILDYDFNDLYTGDSMQSFFWFEQNGFPTLIDEKKNYYFYHKEPEDRKQKRQPLPIFVLLNSVPLGEEEKTECSNSPEGELWKKFYSYNCEQVMHYALFNLETKKTSPFSYMEVRKFCHKDEEYYWGFYDFEGLDRTTRKVDIYNSKGKLIRQINAYYWVDYCSQHRNPVVYAKSGENYMLFDIAGNKLSSVVHHSHPHVLLYVDKHLGVIHRHNEDEGTLRFYDLDNKPLLGERVYYDYDIIDDEHDNIQAVVLNTYNNFSTLVSNKFEILADTCSVSWLDAYTLNDLENEALLVTTKSKAYVFDNGKFSLLDASFFRPDEEMLELRTSSGYVKIDRLGNIIPEPADPVQIEQTKCGSIFLRPIEEGILHVEDKNHQLIQSIKNVERYKTDEGLVEIILKNNERGVLSRNTGQWLFPPGDRAVQAFQKQYGKWYWINYGTTTSPQWRLIDSTSNQVTKQVFDDPIGFRHRPWTVFSVNGNFGIIDTNFTVIMKPEYTYYGMYNGQTFLYKDTSFSLVDPTTGKAFRLEKTLVNEIYPNGHLLFWGDSIQVLAMDGKPLTKVLSVDQAMEQLDLNKLLNGKKEINGLSDAVRKKIYNRLLIESARQHITNLEVYRDIIYPKCPNITCNVQPIWISRNSYSEKVSGFCYTPPLREDSLKQNYFYNNYRIENDNLIPLKLEDLFKPGSGYEQVLDSLIEKEIQKKQFFGTTCIDMPGAVLEFKRNFYFDNRALYLAHYQNGSTIILYFKQLEGLLIEAMETR